MFLMLSCGKGNKLKKKDYCSYYCYESIILLICNLITICFTYAYTFIRCPMLPIECDICLQCYNEGKRLPRSLSCGHTLCTLCIAQIMKRGPLKCPFCRSHHTERIICPADVPLNDALVGYSVNCVHSTILHHINKC